MPIHMKAQMAARVHALEEAQREGGPFESCGVVVNDEYIRCVNTADDPTRNFKISALEMLKLQKTGKIQMVYHSHPGGDRAPSEHDMASQIACGHPYGVIEVNLETMSASTPIEWGDGVDHELLGREFVPGIFDCYSLIRDYYKQKLNIILPDFPRKVKWWELGDNLYEDNFAKAGFREVKLNSIKEVQLHDVMLVRIHKNIIDHGMIYIGGNSIMHHYGIDGRVSEVDESGLTKWFEASRMAKIVRHQDLF